MFLPLLPHKHVATKADYDYLEIIISCNHSFSFSNVSLLGVYGVLGFLPRNGAVLFDIFNPNFTDK